MSALQRQTVSAQTLPTKPSVVQLNKLCSDLLEAHDDHGINLVEGCRLCIYRAAFKIQNQTPTMAKAKAFLANIPLATINEAIRDVSLALDNYEQVKEMSA